MAPKFPQQFGPYTLQELIARGGMAEVYRATMPGVGGFEKTVAIKKILPHLAENEEFIAMLVDEARIIVSLNHANIAQVYDLGRIDDTYYIAMEYVHAVDLADVIKELKNQGKTVPISHATYIAGCICAGLHVAHSKTDEQGRPLNIVHRDVSPHNVLVSFGGDVKIIDFGVAKARGKETHTKAGVIKGKLLYMAPEQAMAKDIDGRADLFAAGLILYSMLTNQLPFEGENEFQIYNNILSKEVVPPKVINPQVPEDLNQIVMMLLQRDANKRYQDGYSAKVDLDRCLHAIAPGYSVSRLSAWVEDNFTQVAMAKRQRRDNPSGRNLPETPAHVNQTGPAPQQSLVQPQGFGFGGAPASGSFGGVPQGAFAPPANPGASGQFGAAPGFGQPQSFGAGASGQFGAGASGQFGAGASGQFGAAGASGQFGAAGSSGQFGGGYGQPTGSGFFPDPSQSGSFPGAQPTPHGGFGAPGGFGSGQFGAMQHPGQSGGFPQANMQSGMYPHPNAQSGMFAQPPMAGPPPEEARKFPLVPVLAIFGLLIVIGALVFLEVSRRNAEAAKTIPAPISAPQDEAPPTAAQVPAEGQQGESETAEQAAAEPEPQTAEQGAEGETAAQGETAEQVEEGQTAAQNADGETAAQTNGAPDVTTVALTLNSSPDGAAVFLDGQELGKTPLELSYDKDAPNLKFEARLDGYETANFAFAAAADAKHTFVLLELPKPKPAQTKSTKKTTKKTTKPAKTSDDGGFELLGDTKKTSTKKTSKSSKKDSEENIINPFE